MKKEWEASRKKHYNAVRKKIFIVDDHCMTRFGLSQLIARQKDLQVCGEAENVAQAAHALKPPLPHLILTDISMPGKSGLEFIKDLTTQHPHLPVLVLSMHDETIFAERVLRAGARGYIMKTEGGEKLLDAIRWVLDGKVYVSPRVSANLLGTFSGGKVSMNTGDLNVLTDREFEVFGHLSQGLPTNEISQALNISHKTVETHRRHIKEKLKLKSGAEVRKFAVRWGASQGMI